MADIVQPDIALKDLEERWGVARNTLKNWANKLKIEIKNPTPRSAFWPGEFIDLGDQLNDWMKAGNELAAFPYILSLTDQQAPDSKQPEQAAIIPTGGSQLAATTADSDQPGAIQRIDTITPLPEEVDPHAAWDGLAKAMAPDSNGRARWYPTEAMALILRRSRSTVAGWSNNHEVGPDCFLEKRKIGNDVWWRVYSTRQPAGIETPDMSAPSTLTALPEREGPGLVVWLHGRRSTSLRSIAPAAA